MNQVRTEDPAPYGASNDDIIQQALVILEGRLRTIGPAFPTPLAGKQYVMMKMAILEHETFAVLWLTCQNRLIEYEEMFRGTLTQTSVYPREVVKAALRLNAGAAIFVHNHPSGAGEPSRADELLTTNLKNALALVDVKVLDHLIVAGMETVSFAERGLL